MGRREQMLYGMHPVREVLRAQRRPVRSLALARSPTDPAVVEIVQLAKEQGVAVTDAGKSTLDQWTQDGHHQGVVAEVGPYPYATLASLIDRGQSDGKGPFLLLLDHVQDPQNFGAMIRTALGCGVHGIVVTKDHAASVTPAVARASAGAVEWMHIAQVVNLTSCVNELKTKEIWVVGLAGRGTQSVYDYKFVGGHAVVMGAEGKGLRRLVAEHCDALLSLPMHGAVESYNVAVAGAMVLGEVMRQRL